MADQHPTSFRFSKRAADALQRIAEVTGLKKATIVEMALVRLAAWVEAGWRPPGEEATGGPEATNEPDPRPDPHADITG